MANYNVPRHQDMNEQGPLGADNKAPVTQNDTDVFVRTGDDPKEGIKEYIQSNFVRTGVGPDAWFSTTQIARREMYGAAEVGIAQNIKKNSAN